MKRAKTTCIALITVLFLILFVFALFGCAERADMDMNVNEYPLSPLPNAMPDDFYFAYKVKREGDFERVLIDTRENVLGVITNEGLVGYLFIDYDISGEDLRTIYDALVAHDIPRLSRDSRHVYKDVGISHHVDHDIVFHVSNQLYTVYYDATVFYPFFANHDEIIGDSERKLAEQLWLFQTIFFDFHARVLEQQGLPKLRLGR